MGDFNSQNFGNLTPGFNPTVTPSQLTVKVYDVLYAAYRIAGISGGVPGGLPNAIRPQRGLSPEQIEEGLQIFNQIVDGYNSQRFLVLSIGRKVFNIAANQSVYLIGPTGDWVTPRPPKIEEASLISLQNAAQPLELPMAIFTFDNWQRIPVKAVNSTYPRVLWYNASNDVLPNGEVNLWPVPSIANQIAIYGWSQIAQQVSADTQLILAPGYPLALQYDCAVELCPRWSKPVTPDIRAAQVEYKKNIKSVNAPTLDLRCDAALVSRYGTYNWRSDTWGPGGY
jgi:hypothetical protein